MPDFASGANMNWTRVSYTVNSVAYPILDVVEMSFPRGGQPALHRGGGDAFPRLITIPFFTRSAQLTSINIASMASLPTNVLGTLAGILNEPTNGEGLGALACVLRNATLIHNPFHGRQNEYGVGSLVFLAISADGTTDPFSVSETV